MAKEIKAFDVLRCFVDSFSLDFNQVLYIARSKDTNCLVGLVWGQVRYGPQGKALCFDVHGSFIPLFCRRCGIRSLINEAIFKEYPAIITPDATDEGRKFLKARGFKKDPILGFVKKRK